MRPSNLLKVFIILLFSLLAGNISVVAASETVVIGTITAIDKDKRELIVSPVHAAKVTGETGFAYPVHVRLEWDLDPDTPFTLLLPGCATKGNAVRLNGMFDKDRFFLADTIHGCGAGDFSDNTGVRYRLNRARGACAAP